MKYQDILEEETKNKVAKDFFSKFDCTKILGKIDFAVCAKGSENFLLWAEAKKDKDDVLEMLTQLVLTIGKARTFDKVMPPPFLGSFDCEKIAFVPYSEIQHIFYQNDFNWKVTPSNRTTKEFQQALKQVKKVVENDIPWETYIFDFGKDKKELQQFIKNNFVEGKTETTKLQIDKNNFVSIYNKWLKEVQPTIAVAWEKAKSKNIIDGDFYLADLISDENQTLKDKLFVLLKGTYYIFDRILDETEFETLKQAYFKDNGQAHTQFWAKYKRPPKEEYWDYMVDHRHLLVPQDIRERKGSFYTPQLWVELSQKYIVDVLGENWQEEYYIWDCAAGTGNLLAGLTEKHNIWASTLDKQDVDVMHDRIRNGANLLESHVFQFDFLNDSFNKLPNELQNIINDTEKRKKLIIYINPPMAEATAYGIGGKPQVANKTKIFNDFKHIVGANALTDLQFQFFVRIYQSMPDVKLASFSNPKFINSTKYLKFRKFFNAKYEKGFICNAKTFDNVKQEWTMGFFIWNLADKQPIKQIETDIINNDKELTHCWQDGKKNFFAVNGKTIATWRSSIYDESGMPITYMIIVGPFMQSNRNTFITNTPKESYIDKSMVAKITPNNLIDMSVYLTVRQCFNVNWANNRDPYLSPKNDYKKDLEFQNDCFIFALFDNQNKTTSNSTTNYLIPYTAKEVNSPDNFENTFLSDFIAGKIQTNNKNVIFNEKQEQRKMVFSKEAQAVFNAGKELWKYYLQQPKVNVNASFYDIRAYFQGVKPNGDMNTKSDNKTYNQLITNLRNAKKLLKDKITSKVYEYGFLVE